MAGRRPIVRRRPLRDVALSTRARVRLWTHDGDTEIAGLAAHAGVEVSFVVAGHARYRIGSQTFVVSPDDVLVVPAEAEHHTSLDVPLRGVALWLDPSLIAEIGDAVSSRGTAGSMRTVGFAEPGSMPTLFRLLERELYRGADGWRLAADALLEAIVVELLRARAEVAPSGPRDPRIATALEAIETRFAEPLSVDDLARAAKMSRFHFSRLFRQEVGAAPYQHLLRVRISRAAELLRRGRRTVTEAALEVGFQDLSRFGALFRTQIGCRPSALARASRGFRASPS